MKRIFWGLFLLLSAAACEPHRASVTREDFDVDALLDDQVKELSKRKLTLTKRAVVDNHVSDTTFLPSTDAWRSDLEIFRQLGMINNTMYHDRYLQEGPLDDARSNLQIKRFSSQAAPLTSLRIYYQERESRIRKIEGELVDQNELYASHQSLVLEFEEFGGKPVLTSYQVMGYQKVALRDTVHFLLKGTINW